MLTHEKIVHAVKKAANEFPILKVDYFGSYADGKATEDSDLDLLVEFIEPAISILSIIKLKHGISFYEAMTVFDDDNALYKPDRSHSDNEDRFIILGFSTNPRLLVVCHCYKESETVIRIISARKATSTEREQYGG